MLNGPVSGLYLSNVKLFSIPVTQLHHSSVRGRVRQEFKALAGRFSVNRRRERQFGETGGPEMRVSQVKANVRGTGCQVCVHMPVYMCVWLKYSCSKPTVNFKMPKSNCCSLLLHFFLYHFNSRLSSLNIFLSPPIALPDSGLKKKWRCSGMQECPRNRKSQHLKSQTTPSSSQVYTLHH